MLNELIVKFSRSFAAKGGTEIKAPQKPLSLGEQFPGLERYTFFPDVDAHTTHIAPKSGEQVSVEASRAGRIDAQEQKELYNASGIVNL